MSSDQQTFLPPADLFEVPVRLVGEGFRLEPLGPQHNEGDLAAWSGSIAHVRATPGFLGNWPPEEGMSPEANLADLVRHARDFAERRGFTYSLLEGEEEAEEGVKGEVIGCLYIYPAKAEPGRVHVTSWVRRAVFPSQTGSQTGSQTVPRPGPRSRPDYTWSSASSATPVIRCSGYVRTSSAVWS